MKSGLLLLALVVLGKLLGFAKELVITYQFGVSLETDAFFVAVAASSVLYMFIYAAIPVALVPKVTSLEDKKVPLSLAAPFLLASLFLSGIVWLKSEFILTDILGVGDQLIERSSLYLKLMALTFPLSTVVAILNAGQSVRRLTLLIYLSPILNNLAFIAAALIYPVDNGFVPILWAGIGAWVALIVLNLGYLKLNLGHFAVSVFNQPKRQSIEISGLMVICGFMLLEQLYNYLPIYFSGHLGEGAVSYFSYANKLNLLVLSVFIMFLSSHVLPKMSGFESSKDLAENVVSGVNTLFLMVFPVVVLASYYSAPIVELVFMRGNFQEQDAQVVARTFSLLIPVFPLMALKELLYRVLIVLDRRHLTLFVILVMIAVMWVVSNIWLGIEGICLGLLASLLFCVITFIGGIEQRARGFMRAVARVFLYRLVFIALPGVMLLLVDRAFSLAYLSLIIFIAMYMTLVLAFDRSSLSVFRRLASQGG